MMARSTLGLLVASALLFACGKPDKPTPAPAVSAQAGSAPLPEPDKKTRLTADDLAPHQTGCKTDDDCEVIRGDCCGCPRGGASSAVVRGHKSQVDGLLSCNGVHCGASENLACKSERAVCRAGTCAVESGAPDAH